MHHRREFLKRLSLASTSLAFAPGSLFASTATPKRVAIVGAGLAGLAAGYELQQAGAEVTIFEAQGHPGGRVMTLREGFADGFFAEAGGDLIGSSYRTLMSYVRRFDLSLLPLAGPEAITDVLVVLGDRRIQLSELRRDPSLWPLELSDAERRVAPFGLLHHYLGEIVREIGDPVRVLDDAFARYDGLSLHDLLVERGASEAAIRLIEIPLNYNSVRTVSALSVLRDHARRLAGGRGTFGIAGGNDRLTSAFADRLRERIEYRAAVQRVEHSADGVQLSLDRRGQTDQVKADAVLLTLPFTALRHVEFAPALPDARAQMIRELPYTQISKTFIQTRSRFWRDDAGVSAIWTDGPCERFFDVSKSFAGPRGLLVGWVNGTGADAHATHADHAVVGETIHGLGSLFPEHRREIESARTVRWAETYARGAYAHYAPGQLQAFAPAIAEPIGRVHFAGEHTELVAPGMEGALVSGVRAAREILSG